MNENKNTEINQNTDLNNTILNNSNQQEQIVTPMNEVTFSQPSDTIENLVDMQNKDSLEPPVSTINSKQENPPTNKPPKKSNTSTVLLIILFVFLFAFIMGMPYINNFIRELRGNGLSEIEKEAKLEEERQKQEEEKKNQPPVEDIKQEELICTSQESTTENYTLVQIQKFYYNSNNQIISSKNISQYRFTLEDNTYLTLKQQCDENSLYLNHEGYTIACSYGENNIEISHEFDLESFKPIDDANIQANATYQQDINTIKAKLIEEGYTCQ